MDVEEFVTVSIYRPFSENIYNFSIKLIDTQNGKFFTGKNVILTVIFNINFVNQGYANNEPCVSEVGSCLKKKCLNFVWRLRVPRPFVWSRKDYTLTTRVFV